MSVTNRSVAVEQSTEQCCASMQQACVPCCRTVAQAARNGHCKEMKQLIDYGTYNS